MFDFELTLNQRLELSVMEAEADNITDAETAKQLLKECLRQNIMFRKLLADELKKNLNNTTMDHLAMAKEMRPAAPDEDEPRKWFGLF